MLDVTDRHCRFLHRLMSRRALLYTEMVVANAIIHGPRARLLDLGPEEHPVALQIGGSDPGELARAVRLARDWPYDEVNLNCGCPSDRVQSGRFGAVLMREPALVADCLRAMQDAAEVPVTVKCRIGVDDDEPAGVLPRFLEMLARENVAHVVIHARKAWLQGLSPRENREIPPLDHELVLAMKARFPGLGLSINGGIATLGQARALLARGIDGVMVGRAAWHDPAAVLIGADALWGEGHAPSRLEVARRMLPHARAHLAGGGRLIEVLRPMLGLFHGCPGAREWRRALSAGGARPGGGAEVLARAIEAVEAATEHAAGGPGGGNPAGEGHAGEGAAAGSHAGEGRAAARAGRAGGGWN